MIVKVINVPSLPLVEIVSQKEVEAEIRTFVEVSDKVNKLGRGL